MIVNKWREGNIDNVDEYYAARDSALSNVNAPPPTQHDYAQLIEAYCDNDGKYDYDHPERNPKQRALVYWSDTLYDAETLKRVIPPIIPNYNEFKGVDTIERLTAMYPDALFLPGREDSVVIYVYGPDGAKVKKPLKREQARLKCDECVQYPITRGKAFNVLRLLWY